MAFCPNVNLQSWKDLVSARGEDMAYYLWDLYEGNVPAEEYQKSFEQMEEEEETKTPEFNTEVLRKVKGFLDRIGVNTQQVQDIVVNGTKFNATAVADFTRKLIQYTKGDEEVLTREAMHFAVEILEQTNPDLVNSMISQIGKYDVYKETLREYSDNPYYQTPEGKPDIRKIKKEAIGKKLGDMYIEKVYEDTYLQNNKFMLWWEKVKNFFRELFNRAGFDPFEEGVAKIMSEEDMINGAQSINAQGVMFELENAKYPRQAEVMNRIKARNVVAVEEGYKTPDSPEVIKKRVTDIIKEVYGSMFDNRDITKTEYQALLDDIKREYGDAIHADIRHILENNLLNKDGSLRATDQETPRYVPKTNELVYGILQRHLRKRLEALVKKYPDMKFMVETPVANDENTLAGTIDFMGITNDGKVLLLDWKSFDLSTDIYNDVPWYKQRAWRRQLLEYRKILMSTKYGLKEKDFLSESAAIPIKANYKYYEGTDGQYYPTLKSISIGDVDLSTEDKDYLLPVPVDQTFVEDKVLNKLLRRLNGLRENIQEKTATTPSEKFAKKEQLQFLDKALRHILVKHSIDPLLEQAYYYTNEIKDLFETYDTLYKDKDFKEFTKAQWEDLDNFALRLEKAFDEIDIYTNLDNELRPLLDKIKSDEEYEKKATKVTSIVSEARALRTEMEEYANNLAEQIGKSQGLEGASRVEKQIDLLSQGFSLTSKIQQRTLQIFYKKRAEAQDKMDFETRDQYDELMQIKKEYDVLAQSKGWSVKNYFNLLLKGDTNKLIDQFQRKFYDDLKPALKSKNYNWIKQNIDVDGFEKALEKEYKEKLAYIAQSLNYEDTKEGKERRKRDIERADREYSIATPESLGWYLHYNIIKQHPKQEKWESQEWKDLHSKANEVVVDGKTVNPAVKLYNWILKVNEVADQAGYIPEGGAKRSFLPFVAKSFTEKLTFGGNITIGQQFLNNITIDESAIGYGEIDKVSKRLIRRIPRYFTQAGDKELSTDLFKNLALYSASLNRYKYLSDIEGIGLLLGRVERNKGSIQTSYWGKPKRDKNTGELDITEKNDKNADFYDRQLATLLYDQRYVESNQFDLLLGKVGGVFDKANKFFGKDIFPTNFSERQMSLNKNLDTLNNYFQQTKLGLNPLSALSNALGGKANAIMISGKYFNKADLFKSEMELSSKNFSGEEGEKIIAAIKYFMPFTDDVNRDMLKELSLATISPNAIQDALFWFMRTGDRFIQSMLFLSNLRNQIIMDGKIVNAREYLRSQPEYAGRYSTPENLKRLESEFDSRVQELIEKHGVLKLAKVENNKLVIPGIDSQSPDVFRIRNVSKDLSTKVLGNITPEQVRGVQQNVYLRSIMVFRNWIPSLVDVRVGALKYDAATDAYEWGRHRAVARFLAVNGILNFVKLYDAVRGTKGGIEALNKLYEYKVKAYEEATGQPLEMTEAEFYDMVRLNIRQSAKDLLIALSAFSMLLGLIISGAGDDEEDLRTKNFAKFTRRLVDKITDEVTFFYNPVAAQNLLNGSIFPSLGVFTDGISVINHFTKEMYGFTFDKKLQEKNHVVKYLLKPFPLSAQFSVYLPLFAPELAKELGMQVGTQSRIR